VAEDDATGPAGSRLHAAIGAQGPLLLDGATGTELEAMGIDSRLPLWSARALLEAPDSVRSVHQRYADAGARLLTANSFRTQRRTLDAAGVGDQYFALTELAVRLARQGAQAAGSDALVAGSAPPLEDCYHPERVPDEGALQREHAEHAAALARAGADCILVETMNTVREARAAADAAAQTGLPLLVSFVSWEAGRLLSGEPLREGLDAVAEYSPAALLVNCLPPSAVAPALAELRRRPEAFGVYANLGGPVAGGDGLQREALTPEQFADHALDWVGRGARIVGGCCGTTPAHIAQIHRRMVGAAG
jgi:S-methylmethionine-dependent homocysteine/selenocysteine methylase